MGSGIDRNGKPKIDLEELFYKNYASVVRNPSDSEIKAKTPSRDCKGNVSNASVMKKHSVSENKNFVIEIPLTSKENESLLENLTTCKDYGNVIENTWPSSDGNKNPMDFPLFGSEDNTGVLENSSVLKNAEDELFFRGTKDLEDGVLHMETSLREKSRKLNESEDANVDILECVNSSATVVFETDNNDMTESSSSFDDLLSENEHGSGFSDAEVNSSLFIGNTSASAFIDFSKALHKSRNKRLTDHWKNSIRHIQWRCGWLELHLKELGSQSLQYKRELAKYDHRKQFEFELDKLISEEVGAKSLPFCNHVRRMKMMKRKKRKRVEDTVDIASYMCHHNLFSYFENKNFLLGGGMYVDDKGSKPVSTLQTVIPDDFFGGDEEWSKLQFRDGDVLLEQILREIDVMQSQVQKMKGRADKVVSEFPRNFSSINMMSSILVPCDANNSSQDPVFPPCNEDIILARPRSESGMADHDNPPPVQAHRDVTTPRSADQPPVQASYRNTEEILVNNMASEKEWLDSVKAREEQHASTVPFILIPDDDQAMETYAECAQLPVRSVTNAKPSSSYNVRKSKRRKVSARKWS